MLSYQIFAPRPSACLYMYPRNISSVGEFYFAHISSVNLPPGGPDLSLASFRLLHSSLRSNSEGETRNGTELDDTFLSWWRNYWLEMFNVLIDSLDITYITSLLKCSTLSVPGMWPGDHLVFLFLSFKSSFNFLWSLPCLWMRFLLKIKFTRMLKTDLTIHHWIVGSKRY